MSELVLKKSKGELHLKNEIIYPESVNERNLFFLSKNVFPDFLALESIKTKKKTFLDCNFTGLLSLEALFKNPVSKQQFLHIISLMIGIIRRLKGSMLKESCLCFDSKYIFYNQQEDTIKMIYWPIVNNQLASTFGTYVKNLIRDVNVNDVRSQEFIGEYEAFFDTIDPFSLNKFEKMVDSMVGNQHSNNMNETGLLVRDETGMGMTVGSFYSANAEYDPFAALMSSQTYWAMDAGEHFQDSSTQWQEQGTQMFARASLIRQKNQERIPIMKAEFVIGKGKQGCDYRVDDNSAISRQHAQIAEKDGKYYLADLNSSNKTFLNDFELKPQQYYEIESGSIIMLANEKFEFVIG